LGAIRTPGVPPRREELGKGRQSERLAFQHVGKGWEEGVGVPGGGRSGRTGKGVLGRVCGWQSGRREFQHVGKSWEEGVGGVACRQIVRLAFQHVGKSWEVGVREAPGGGGTVREKELGRGVGGASGDEIDRPED
jgi:hypothetical protein